MIYATQKLVKGVHGVVGEPVQGLQTNSYLIASREEGVHGVVGEPVQGLQARLDPDLRRELSVGEFVY